MRWQLRRLSSIVVVYYLQVTWLDVDLGKGLACLGSVFG